MKFITLFLTCLIWLGLLPAWAATTIDVANVQELVAQIGSHRELRLAPGTYDLGGVAQPAAQTGSRIYNGGLLIYEVQDLTLVGSGAGQTKIISPFMESNVLTFTDCADIQVKDLSVGHTVVPGGCQGDAVLVNDSRNLKFIRTDIYGCGQYSLTLRFVDNILVQDSKLHDCSYGLLDATIVHKGRFVNTQFIHNGKLSAINANHAVNLSFDGCRFFIDPDRKAYSYKQIPIKEYVAHYSLCSQARNVLEASDRKLRFKHCEFSNVDPAEFGLLKSEGVTF
jgi:hypothetical protein